MHVTVCICTRNRGASIAATLRSLVAATYADFDVLIVDQSVTEETAQAIQAEVGEDKRFSYLRSPTVGKSIALNIAVAQARGPLIAFTDDDCEVKPNWLSVLVDTFSHYPDAGEVCGPVLAVPHNSTRGYIPTHMMKRPERVRSLWRMWRASGIGANMAFRQEALKAAGPFDELLGPGAEMHNSEDTDMTCRILEAGYSVCNEPEAIVLHSGFRSWDEDGKLILRRAYLSASLVYMKYLRLGNVAILPTLLCNLLSRCIYWKKVVLFRWRGGLGVRNLLSFLQGMRQSFHYGVDRQRRIYVLRKSVS
jgi:glycosyltransferase involved in cell wall biosynthesis